MSSLANPMGIAFWAGVGGGLIVTLEDAFGNELAMVLTSVMVAIVVWVFVLSAGIRVERRHPTPRLFPVVNVATGIVLGRFGLWLLLWTQQPMDWARSFTGFVTWIWT